MLQDYSARVSSSRLLSIAEDLVHDLHGREIGEALADLVTERGLSETVSGFPFGRYTVASYDTVSRVLAFSWDGTETFSDGADLLERSVLRLSEEEALQTPGGSSARLDLVDALERARDGLPVRVHAEGRLLALALLDLQEFGESR